MIDSNIINCAPLFHPTGKQLPNSKDHLKGSRRSKVAELQGCIEAFLLFILTWNLNQFNPGPPPARACWCKAPQEWKELRSCVDSRKESWSDPESRLCPETNSSVGWWFHWLRVVFLLSAVCQSLSTCLLQYETLVSLCNSCLSSPIPPSPPECNKCPAIIYFNSLPSCTDEMDS